MKLAFVNYSLSAGGGMERYLVDIVKECTHQGDDVVVAARKIDFELASTLGIKAVPLKVSPLFPRILGKALFAKRASRWMLAQAQSHNSVISLVRAPGATLMACGGTHLGHLAQLHRSPTFSDRREIQREKDAYASANRIIAHSKLLQDELNKAYGIKNDKIVLLYPPVDTNRFQISLKTRFAEFRKKFNLGNQKQLLFPSSGHYRKGLDILIDAVKILPEESFQIVIAGKPPPRNVPPFVKYVGYVDNIQELYAACDATVMPSRYEPFGLVYVESLLCGTPVVVPCEAGAAEVLPEANAIRLCERTPQNLAEVITKVANEFSSPIDLAFLEKYKLTLTEHVMTLRSIAGNLIKK